MARFCQDDPKPVVLCECLLEFVQIANDLRSRASIEDSSLFAEDKVMKNRHRKIIVRPTASNSAAIG